MVINAKIYNAMLLICIQPEIETNIWKYQNNFLRNCLRISQIVTIRWIIIVQANHCNTTACTFFKVLHSPQRGKMEQTLLAYSLPKETVTTITMLNKNTKAIVHSTDRDVEFYNIVNGVMTEDNIAPYLYMLYQANVLQKSINLIRKNGFVLKKTRC